MARVPLVKPEQGSDPIVQEMFDWVTEMEGDVPNHFYLEMNFPEHFKAKLGATQVLWQMGELDMPEIQHVGIAVSKANECQYCTAAFCTILNYGLGADEDETKTFLDEGTDALEDGRVVSGVGGQYNFVEMAHALPDGHSVLQLRSTRKSKGKVRSNIVWKYGHVTIPRHLRDIVSVDAGRG